jgi:hypothetical protein
MSSKTTVVRFDDRCNGDLWLVETSSRIEWLLILAKQDADKRSAVTSMVNALDAKIGA